MAGYEIITGQLYLTRVFTPARQALAACVCVELGAFVKRERLGKVVMRPPLVFADADYLVPDLVIFPQPWRTPPAPFLAVEGASEGTAERDRGIKRERYAHYGVPEYWIVDAGRRWIEIYRLQQDAERPSIVTDCLRWRPVEGGPVLELDVRELLTDLE